MLFLLKLVYQNTESFITIQNLLIVCFKMGFVYSKLRWFKTFKNFKARGRTLTLHRCYGQSLTAVRANDLLIWSWLPWRAEKFRRCTAAVTAKVILMSAPWEANLAPHTDLCRLCCCSIRPHTDWRHYDYQCARGGDGPETLLRCNQTFI